MYQDALKAYKLIIVLTREFPRGYQHLVEQLRRAALSVILNIAEGSAKNSDKDFNRYIGNSLGSVNEVVAGLEVAFQLNLTSEALFKEALTVYTNITNQLGGFSKKLKS